MNLELENRLLKQLVQILLEADYELGIYPQAVEGVYDKRNQFQEGWNKALIKLSEEQINILNDIGVEILDGDTCLDEPEIIF